MINNKFDVNLLAVKKNLLFLQTHQTNASGQKTAIPALFAAYLLPVKVKCFITNFLLVCCNLAKKYKQKKTGGLEYLDISNEAAALMGGRDGDAVKVFGGLVSPSNANATIRVWAALAGIKKHLSFHCARHTFATMMLDLGVDIYTTSKLLGHSSVQVTQVYAKIIDKNKQAAVARIPSIITQM